MICQFISNYALLWRLFEHFHAIYRRLLSDVHYHFRGALFGTSTSKFCGRSQFKMSCVRQSTPPVGVLHCYQGNHFLHKRQ